MAYDNNFNDELRQRLSIVDIVGGAVPLTRKGANWWGCCPFHNEKTPSFSVNEQKGFYHCFGCGEHGDIISFTMKNKNMNYVDAIKELASIAGIKIPDYKPKSAEQISREQSYLELYESATKFYMEKLYSESGKAALEYVQRRGFGDEVIKKYRIGYAPKNNLLSAKFANQPAVNLGATGLVRNGDYGPYDFFRDRLMFPIFNPNGNVVAFSGRSLDGSEPKYINTTDTEMFHKRATIFGLNFARDEIYKKNRSIVVEGQIDAIQMQTHGFGETIAPLGTALTEGHLQILTKSNRNIVFCFDGDNAGLKAAARALDISMPFLRDNSDIRFAFVSGGKDPDEILRSVGGENKMRKIIDSAKSLTDFLWELANRNYVVATPNGRALAEKFIKSLIEKIPDFTLRGEYKKEFDIRKFNNWHKWTAKKQNVNFDIPKVSDTSKKTSNDIPDDIAKLYTYLTQLTQDRKDTARDLTTDGLQRMRALDREIERVKNEIEKFSY
ncbi:MAG: DNA primase [Rickettsiales bacterium]|jgi:DNA primase|nr:DNA primase [Rickettsiales bacterium]